MMDAPVLTPRASQAPLPAQEDEGTATEDQAGAGPTIRLVDLVDRITHTIVHQFTVEVDSLTASEAYEVIVSSDTAALGIDSCGTTSQTQLVTGTASHAFKVIVYACAVDGGTVTAEVRRSGSSTAAASASQGVTVLPIPDYVPADERPAPAASGAAARATSGAVARVGTPGIVQNVQVAERGPTSFKITWSPPAGNGGEPLTGYGLLIWHKDVSQPPYDQAASIGVTDNHTFTGLQPSNTYNFRIHACNGTDSCGWWTAILEATTTAATPAPGAPTAPHSILSDQIGANSFRVLWSPHAETGGSALTGFGILVRQSGSSWDESQTIWVGKSPPHRSNVTGRDAGTTYVVKIKSCNGPDGESSCSAWSSDHRVTTTMVEVNPGLRPVVLDPIAPECPYTTGDQTVWGAPQNLDVTPHEGRKITLCWTPVSGASGYTVSATHDPTASSPAYTIVKDIASGSSTNLVIDLDDIYGTTPKVGLGNHKAFGLRVTARKTGTSVTHNSDMIIIIDTPITQATTKRLGPEAVRVKWDSVGSILGSSYSNGKYDLRYRKSGTDYSKSPRTEGYFVFTGDPEVNKVSPHTIRNLDANAVYGIQLVYRHPGPSDSSEDHTWVFAARNAYAWVSDQPIPDNSRVAGVPVTSRIQGTAFTYKICTTTFFLDYRLDSWTSLITEAFDRWQAAVTRDLIRIERITDPCTDYHTAASLIREHYDYLETHPVFGGFSKELLIDLVEAFIDTTIRERVVRLRRDDLAATEIKMLDDVHGVEGYLISEEVFPEIASHIGHRTRCWYKKISYPDGSVVWKPSDVKVPMCYDPYVLSKKQGNRYVDRHISGDIFIRRSFFKTDPLLRWSDLGMFNKCGSVTLNNALNSAYKSFLHEAGHALGIGGTAPGITEGAKEYSGHSEDNVSSVVNTVVDPGDCSPYQADIAALYALYQTR